jgi:hypothetical protein
MRYMLLIYGNEQAHEEYLKTLPGGMDAEMGAYFAYNDQVKAAGIYNAAEALLPVATATTVRVRNGETLTTHGPFAETHEQLGGFYLIDCANLDEALAWAAQIPGAQDGSIEVRPVVDFGEM